MNWLFTKKKEPSAREKVSGAMGEALEKLEIALKYAQSLGFNVELKLENGALKAAKVTETILEYKPAGK